MPISNNITHIFCITLIGKEPPEVTFTGVEFLTYDLVQLGGEPILSTRDEISMYFRTNRDDGLLFYSGNSLLMPEKCPICFQKLVFYSHFYTRHCTKRVVQTNLPRIGKTHIFGTIITN